MPVWSPKAWLVQPAAPTLMFLGECVAHMSWFSKVRWQPLGVIFKPPLQTSCKPCLAPVCCWASGRCLYPKLGRWRSRFLPLLVLWSRCPARRYLGVFEPLALLVVAVRRPHFPGLAELEGVCCSSLYSLLTF